MIINRQYDRVIKIIKRKSLINKIIVLLPKTLLYLRYEEADNLQIVILSAIHWYHWRIFLLSKVKYFRDRLDKGG